MASCHKTRVASLWAATESPATPGASTSRRSGPAQATATCPGDDFDWTTQLLSDTVDISLLEVVRTDEFKMWLEEPKDLRGRARIIRRIDRLANGNPGDVRPIGNGLSELRLDVGPGYRVYYLQDADTLSTPPTT